MSALSILITKVTKRQFTMCKNIEEVNIVLDRTIAFAEGEKPYISEEQVAEIAATIPIVDPVTEAEEASDDTVE